ncbi:MAG: four helix bundle protein [Lentimicrobium sp.]|jgi:four helix bundle protein|nr:four helix bundle protein [Lentimicrobium sp.]
MDKFEIQKRMMKLTLDVIKLTKMFPISQESKVISNQIIRCSSSTAANYRAACRAKSIRDFIAKLGIVEEESDETVFWLELIIASGLVPEEKVTPILKEANEIVAMMVRSLKTAKENLKRLNEKGSA